MLNMESLTKVSNGLRSTVASIRRVNDVHNRKVEQLEADGTRSRSYIVESIKAAREEAMPGLLRDLQSMREAAAVAEANREYWSNRSLLMSRILFDKDRLSDALIRLRYSAELAAMDVPLLDLTQRNALDE